MLPGIPDASQQLLEEDERKTEQAENSKPTSHIQIEQFHFYLFDRLAFYLRFLRRKGSGVSGISKSLKEQNDMYNPEGSTYIADYVLCVGYLPCTVSVAKQGMGCGGRLY